ncbi:MAG: DUF1667 domain-containing protein [Roseburia sp.]|nr:DUF1667 domain-containing protein [Roseburia sp.]MCM1279576.1 DUF1667 domain-containing protein [Robinsoniella sp.]
MIEKKELTCIKCPRGCKILVETEQGMLLSVSGNQCKNGKEYAEKEVTAPTRALTTTVKVLHGNRKVAAVKSKGELPREKLLPAMEQIKEIAVEAPVILGETILEDLCGTGIPLVATACIMRKE